MSIPRLSTHLISAAVLVLGACGSDAGGDAPDANPNAADAAAGGDGGGGALAGWCTVQSTNFSFFVTSMDALWKLSGSTPGDLSGGFGGNFGGIAGADAICQTIGAATGHGNKTWRAFLSATDDGGGSPVHAIERIGSGPWYDANDRQVASGVSGLLAADRPDGDTLSTADFPDECGTPISALGDAHDVLTGSNPDGELSSTNADATCNDWTSSSDSVGGGGSLMCGHSFPRSASTGRGASWVSDHPVPGCGKGANLMQGPSTGSCVGCSGGYGAIYCFAQ